LSARRTWERIEQGSLNVAYADFVAVVEAFGFRHARTKGSHRIYSHPGVPRPLPLQPEGGQAKRYQIREFVAVVRRYGLTMEG
jgi:hypothetical protein